MSAILSVLYKISIVYILLFFGLLIIFRFTYFLFPKRIKDNIACDTGPIYGSHLALFILSSLVLLAILGVVMLFAPRDIQEIIRNSYFGDGIFFGLLIMLNGLLGNSAKGVLLMFIPYGPKSYKFINNSIITIGLLMIVLDVIGIFFKA